MPKYCKRQPGNPELHDKLKALPTDEMVIQYCEEVLSVCGMPDEVMNHIFQDMQVMISRASTWEESARRMYGYND